MQGNFANSRSREISYVYRNAGNRIFITTVGTQSDLQTAHKRHSPFDALSVALKLPRQRIRWGMASHVTLGVSDLQRKHDLHSPVDRIRKLLRTDPDLAKTHRCE